MSKVRIYFQNLETYYGINGLPTVRNPDGTRGVIFEFLNEMNFPPARKESFDNKHPSATHLNTSVNTGQIPEIHFEFV